MGDPCRHLVGGCEEIHAHPAGAGGVDERDGSGDAETVCLGVQHPDVESADFLGVGRDVGHAEYGQGVVVHPGPYAVVA